MKSKLSLLALGILALGCCMSAQVAGASTPRVPMTPIVAVHGVIFGDCPAMNSSVAMSGPMWFMWNHGEWGRPYDPISYYRCDAGGSDIGAAADDNTPIEAIAHDLAWYVYNKYSAKNQTIAFVGHSMGGLIIRAALRAFAGGDPTYPPKLLVQDAVTVSTPHAGVDLGCAAKYVQCQEMMPGSPFLKWLAADQSPQGTGGTDWTLIGGSPCDIVAPSSASAMTGSHRWLYYINGPVCYDHSSYLWDSSSATDAIVAFAAPGVTQYGSIYTYHSQAAIKLAVDSSSW